MIPSAKTNRKLNFSTSTIKKLTPPSPDFLGKAIDYSDISIPGLTLQITKLGTMTFHFRYTYKGKKGSLRIGPFPSITVKEAKETAMRYKVMVDRGVDPKAKNVLVNSSPTIADFALKDYMIFAQQTKRSWKSDASKLKHHILPRFGALLLNELTTQMIQNYLGELLKTHSPATVNKHLALLSKLFSTAVDWDKVTKNPCEGIKQFKENNKRDVYLKPKQIKKLLSVMEYDENQTAMAALKLILLTGVRLREATDAKWQDVDLEAGLWYLPKTKSGYAKHVVLSNEAKVLLSSLTQTPNCPFVFPGKDPGKPINNLTKPFGRILKEAGIEHIRIHDLRHTYASLLASNGATLYQIQTLLGHSSPATTQRYAHLCADSLRDTTQIVGDLIADLEKAA